MYVCVYIYIYIYSGFFSYSCYCFCFFICCGFSMEDSKTPSNSRPSFCSDDNNDFLTFFDNLGLDEEAGGWGNQASSSSNNNGVANSPISSYFPQTQIPNWSNNQGPQISDHYNLAINSFINGGSTQYPYLPCCLSGSSVGSSNCTNNYLNFEPTRINSCSGYSLMSYLANQVRGKSMFSDAPGGYNHGHTDGYTMYQNQYSNQRFSATRSNGISLGNEYSMNNNGDLTSSISLQNHPIGSYGETVSELLLEGKNIMSMAMKKDGSMLLQHALQERNVKIRTTILVGVLDHLPQLMSDQYGHYMFQKLVEFCTADELQQILEKLGSQSELLVNAACEIHGSNSIQKFVRKLKKSPFGSYLTAILAPRTVDLATNTTARHVLKECLSLLSYQANKVLYEEAIKNFDILAVHDVGCLAINDCIDLISKAEHRDELLQLVVDKTIFLAYDPSGNFVVQHAIALKNPIFSERICKKLRGHYIQLSTKKFGSHFVEKCIESCISGMTYAVAEILVKQKALELARNEYGNYVIQKALKTTEALDFELCQMLVNALLPNLSELERSRNSKKVVEKIKRIQSSGRKPQCYPEASKY